MAYGASLAVRLAVVPFKLVVALFRLANQAWALAEAAGTTLLGVATGRGSSLREQEEKQAA
jgi:hypothetical protein